MPSPDFSQYVDLTDFDVQPGDLYLDALEYARTSIPEFDPRPGTLEDAIMQAGAYVGAGTIGSVNRLPDGLMEGILRVMGVVRDEPTFGSVNAQFTLFSAGDTVSGDTTYSYPYFDGIETINYVFRLENEVTASVGATTVSANLKSLQSGALPSLPVGTQLIPSEPSSIVFSVQTSAALTQGVNGETDEEFLNRAVTYLQSLSATLNTATQVENYVLLNYSDVKRCKAYDLVDATEFRVSASSNSSHSGTTANVTTSSAFYASASAYPGTVYRIITPQFYGDAAFANTFLSGTFTTGDDSLTINPSGSITYTDGVTNTASAGPKVDVVLLDSLLASYVSQNQEPGFFAVFVCGEDGKPVGRSVRTEIEEDLAEKVPAGLKFKVLDAWTYDLSFTITVGVSPGFNASSVGEKVKDEIETLVSPNEWPNFNDKVRVYEIVAAASNVNGVNFVSSIESEIPEYPNANFGNQKLVQEDVVGTQITGYSSLYVGTLPRATVEVVTL